MLPDAETLALAYLRSRPELAGIAFGTARPADLAARLPFVLLERIGGAASAPSWRAGALVDRAGVTAQAWASPHRADARAVTHRVLHSLSSARGCALDTGVIVRVVVLAGPTLVLDPAVPEDVSSYIATIQMTLY